MRHDEERVVVFASSASHQQYPVVLDDEGEFTGDAPDWREARVEGGRLLQDRRGHSPPMAGEEESALGTAADDPGYGKQRAALNLVAERQGLHPFPALQQGASSDPYGNRQRRMTKEQQASYDAYRRRRLEWRNRNDVLCQRRGAVVRPGELGEFELEEDPPLPGSEPPYGMAPRDLRGR